MRTLIIALSLLVVSSVPLNAQLTFNHALGAGIFQGGDAGGYGFQYSPRLNFLELDDELTLSVGTHIGAGLSANSREGASSLVLDLPLVLELNWGHASTPDSYQMFGAFGGVGFGYSVIGEDSGFLGAFFNKAIGPLVNAGIRATIEEVAPLTLRGSYLINMRDEGDNVIVLSLAYNFGDY